MMLWKYECELREGFPKEITFGWDLRIGANESKNKRDQREGTKYAPRKRESVDYKWLRKCGKFREGKGKKWHWRERQSQIMLRVIKPRTNVWSILRPTERYWNVSSWVVVGRWLTLQSFCLFLERPTFDGGFFFNVL